MMSIYDVIMMSYCNSVKLYLKFATLLAHVDELAKNRFGVIIFIRDFARQRLAAAAGGLQGKRNLG